MSRNKKEEYMYLLGRAKAFSEIYTILETIDNPSKFEIVQDWTLVMKGIFEQTGLWEEATIQNKTGEPQNVYNSTNLSRQRDS